MSNYVSILKVERPVMFLTVIVKLLECDVRPSNLIIYIKRMENMPEGAKAATVESVK